MDSSRLLVAIPSVNGAALLGRMLPSLRVHPASVLVLDQGSTDGTAAVCAAAGVGVLQLGRPHTYTEACNIGAAVAKERGAEFVCVSNNDVVLTTDVLAETVAELDRDPRLAIVSPAQRIIDPALDAPVLSVRVGWHLGHVSFHHETELPDDRMERLEADFCELTLATVRLSAIDHVGFLDDGYGFYHEDADFGFRLRRAGWGCAYLPRSRIDHFTGSTFSREHAARKAAFIARNRRRFAAKHGGHGVRLEPATEPDDLLGLPRQRLTDTLDRFGLLSAPAPALLLDWPEGAGRFLFTAAPALPAGWPGPPSLRRAVFAAHPELWALGDDRGPGQVFPVPAGIDPDVFHPWGRDAGPGPGLSVVAPMDGDAAQVATTERAVLAAWAGFVNRGAGWLRLVGPGTGSTLGSTLGRRPDAAHRQGRFDVSRWDAERVEALRPLPDATAGDLAALFRAADLALVLPGAPCAVLHEAEALACGTPCLPGTGAVLPPDAAANLAAALDAFGGLDAAGRRALGAVGVDRVRHGGTLRHTALALHAALARLQVRDPGELLARLDGRPYLPRRSRPEPATVPAPVSGAPVATADRLMRQFQDSWQSDGLLAAGRGLATEAGYFAQGRWRRVFAGAPEPQPLRAGVQLIGYIDANLGLGQSLRGLALAMEGAGLDFSIFPFGIGVEGRRGEPYMPHRYDGEGRYACNVMEVTCDELPKVWAHWGRARFAGSTNILRTYWELGRAPEAWRPQLEGIGEIWAPNPFVAEAFRAIFDGPITVVPPCVSPPEPPRDGRARFGLREGAFTFMFSFDYFSFPQRKNPMAVVRAFRRAFPKGTEAVSLVVKSIGHVEHHPGLKHEMLVEAAADGRVVVIDRALSAGDMGALMGAVDCFVSMHRAEGFGLGMAEAMALGKPVIATAYSGNAEFVTSQTAFPVPFRLVPVGPGEYVHAENQVWADPDEDACAAIMAQVVADPAATAARAEAGRRFVRDRFSPETVGRIVAARLREIGAVPG